MVMKESSFVREVENRLDVLFGIGLDPADRSRNAGPDQVNARDILEDIAVESGEEAGQERSAASLLNMDDHSEGNDESASAGRDGRCHILLEEAGKETETDSFVADHPSLDEIASVAESPEAVRDGDERFERIFGDISSFTPALFSPVKNLKSIILSLEWEISDAILNRLDAELSGLQELYRNERTILGFLRILRFLERYIRVKQGDSHTESIKLLFSIYDDLERIILSITMAEEIKRAILMVDIGKYRNWVENIDLSACPGADIEENGASSVAEPRSPVPEALPSADVEEGRSADGFENAGPDVFASMKTMEPHEAFACALEEIRKMIHSEFEALRAEMRMHQSGKTQPPAGADG